MSFVHCELHDSVNHLEVESIFLCRFVLEIMFSECHCVWVWVGCGCGWVDGFNMDVLVRVHGCVSLHFHIHFIFRVFHCFFLFFSR